MEDARSSVIIPIILLNFSHKKEGREGGQEEKRRCYVISEGKSKDTKELPSETPPTELPLAVGL